MEKTVPEPEWVTVEEALRLCGYSSRNSLTSFIKRHNNDNPTTPILKRHGVVEKHTLLQAIKTDSVMGR